MLKINLYVVKHFFADWATIINLIIQGAQRSFNTTPGASSASGFSALTADNFIP